jgi:hypothetical protein
MAWVNKAQPSQPSTKPVIKPSRKAKVIASITSKAGLLHSRYQDYPDAAGYYRAPPTVDVTVPDLFLFLQDLLLARGFLIL